jgi:hypothetical protein
MAYWVRAGCAWRPLPHDLPPWQTVSHPLEARGGFRCAGTAGCGSAHPTAAGRNLPRPAKSVSGQGTRRCAASPVRCCFRNRGRISERPGVPPRTLQQPWVFAARGTGCWPAPAGRVQPPLIRPDELVLQPVPELGAHVGHGRPPQRQRLLFGEPPSRRPGRSPRCQPATTARVAACGSMPTLAQLSAGRVRGSTVRPPAGPASPRRCSNPDVGALSRTGY